MTDRHAPRVRILPIPISRAMPFVRSVHRRLPKIQVGATREEQGDA